MLNTEDRVVNARVALQAHLNAAEPLSDDPEGEAVLREELCEAAQDLITDLLHYCRERQGEDFDVESVLRMALANYGAEIEPDDLENAMLPD